MIDIIKIALSEFSVKHTDCGLKEIVEETPYVKTMYGVSAILWRYKIKNECVRYKIRHEIIGEQIPCLVVIEGKFRILQKATKDRVRLLSADGTKAISWNHFESLWNGVALHLYPDSDSCEPDYKKHRTAEIISKVRFVGLVSALIAVATIGMLTNEMNISLLWWALVAINVCGCGIGFLLLQKQLHIDNGFTDRLCGLIKESHCEKVTDSSGADLLGLVKLSEVGFGFFTVNTAVLLFFSGAIQSLATISVMVLPFSFWSIWYQKFVAKSWCVLCLATLAAMWLQAICYVGGGVFGGYHFDVVSMLMLSAAYVIAVIGTHYAMQLFEKKTEAKKLNNMYRSLKSREEVVESIEGKANNFMTDTDNCSSLTFGADDAPCHVTIFSNPYCGPCAMMHERVKDMPGGFVRITYALTYFSKELSNINRYIIAAYKQLGAKKTWELMTKWYKGGKIEGESFFKDYDLRLDDESVAEEFEKQRKWSNDKRLVGTPTVIVNNREIVSPYTVEDYVIL